MAKDTVQESSSNSTSVERRDDGRLDIFYEGDQYIGITKEEYAKVSRYISKNRKSEIVG